VARTASRKDILEGPIIPTMFKLAWPLMISSLLHYLYNMADTFWVGHLPPAENATAVAGLQIAGPVIFFLMAFAFGFNAGGLALVSQYMGAHRREEANKAAAQTLSLSIVFGLLIMVAGVLFSPFLLKLLTSDAAVAAAGTIYTRIVFVGMPFEFVAAAYAQVMAAYGDTVTPMLINLVCVLGNIVLDPLMIFGIGPFARMTVAGAALATIIWQAVAATLSLVLLLRGRHGLHVTWWELSPDWSWYRRILKIGLPSSIGVSGTSFGFLVLTGIIGRVSNATVALSAYGIGDRFINVSFIAIDGLSLAISTMVATRWVRNNASVPTQSYGEGQPSCLGCWWSRGYCFGSSRHGCSVHSSRRSRLSFARGFCSCPCSCRPSRSSVSSTVSSRRSKVPATTCPL